MALDERVISQGMRIAILLLVACAAPLAPKQPSPVSDDQLFWRAVDLKKGPEHDALLAKLIADYPSSKYRDDAYVQLGDTQFEASQFSSALASYRAVTSKKYSGYAHYKIAWTYHSLNDEKNARDELDKVIAMDLTGKQKLLHDAAQKDLAEWTNPEPIYLRADALYAQKDFCAAAPLFAQVAVTAYANQVEAAYAHVLSVRSCEHLENVSLPKSEVEVTIPANWQRLLDATNLYLDHVTDSPELPGVQFLRAHIFYAFGHFAMAARNFREVVRRSTDKELRPPAATLLLDSDNRGKLPELESDFRSVCAMKFADLAQICAAT